MHTYRKRMMSDTSCMAHQGLCTSVRHIAAMFRAYGQCLCCMHPFGEFPVFIGRTHEVLRGFLVWCFVLFCAIPDLGFERKVAVPFLLLVRDV